MSAILQIDPRINSFFSDVVEQVDSLEESVQKNTSNCYGVNIALNGLKASVTTLARRAEQARNAIPEQERQNPLISQRIWGAFDSLQQKAKNVIEVAQKFLSEQSRRLELQERWKKLGLPEEVFDIAPDCVEKLFESGVVYSMVGFSTVDTISRPFKIRHGKIYVYVEEKEIEWGEFDKRYVWNQKAGHFVCRDDENIRLMYVSKGFIKADSWKYTEPFPVLKLTGKQLAEVKAQACQFGNGDRTCDGVLQIYTSPGGYGLPRAVQNVFGDAIKDNLDTLFSHYVIRVITPEGDVYSIGVVMDEYITPLSLFKTLEGNVRMLDYDEFRRFPYGRVLTSVPISQEQVDKVFAYIENIQKTGGFPYNFGNQSCITLVEKLMQLADVDICLDTDFSEMAWMAIRVLISGISAFFTNWTQFFGPEVQQVTRTIQNITSIILYPVTLGFQLLSSLVNKVEELAKTVFETIYTYVPSLVKHVFAQTVSVVAMPIDMLKSLFKTLIVWVLGGTRMSARAAELAQINPNYRTMLSMDSWTDIFSSKITNISSSLALLRWQKEQKSTKMCEDTGNPQFVL